MQTTISASSYKDQPAVLLESDQLQALILPERGANLASLIYKPANAPVIFQRPGDVFRVQPFDGVYTEAENAGMDDMFPTIDASFCTDHPWKGVPLADHGEVWSLPWQAEHDAQETHEADGLRLQVHGIRLPYTLEKRVHFPAANILRMDYRLTNHSPFPITYLWAAHAMFNSEAGAEILLPPGPDSVTMTFSINSPLGKYGSQYAWPTATLPDGSKRALNRLRGKEAGEVGKYYINGALPEGWCAAKFPGLGYAVGLSWPADHVPYLAILPNEGGWDDATSLYFEPSTCTFDRPDVGQYRGEVSVLAGSAVHEWHLNLSVTDNLDFTKVTPEGMFR